MSYQQSSFSDAMARVQSRRRGYAWSDSAQINANQQGIVTQEQRAMLDKGPGCLYILVFCLFIFSIVTTCITIVTVIYLLFIGKFILLGSDALVRLLILLILTPILGKLSSVLRKAHNARFTRDIDALVVERGQGEVIWENGRYIARIPGFRLITAAKRLTLPPPGPYHFYYLAGQKILLSAQPIHTFTQAFAQPGMLAATGLTGDEQARLALQMALCSVLGFSLDDLYANSLGMLTDAQRRKLSVRVFWSIVGCFIGLLISGGFLGLGIMSILHWITGGSGTDLIFPLLIFGLTGLVLLAIFLGCLHYLVVGAGRRYMAIQHEPVQYLEGNLQTRLVSGDGDSSDSYYYDIGQLSFKVTEAAFKALISGMLYRVYYIASSKTLVSVQALEAPAR
ncbi:MAG: hypothetical protein JO031_14630 [Ktedonobacteraceae bacterium]|nr:hypothetical protein [Ktedonobacteraceae bacterium]